MPYQGRIPKRVRVLILGGGIHGVGVLHDLLSRGIPDVFLCEKQRIGSGTSSKSTKLIHGGLRYLKHITDFPLVSEALHERQLLMTLAPDLVRPVELYLPVLKKGGEKDWMIRAGLTLYDCMAGRRNIYRHRKISYVEALQSAPVLSDSLIKGIYSFWDAQTDDLALVHRVAESAVVRGGQIHEFCRIVSLRPCDDGWIAGLQLNDGAVTEVSALCVVNTLGPWANRFLESVGLDPLLGGVNNKGAHCLFPDIGLKVGLLLQGQKDGRVFFLLPWMGMTLLGTTEGEYRGDPDQLAVSPEDIHYLLNSCNPYLKEALREEHMIASFAGLRWLASEKNRDLTSLSRDHHLTEHVSGRGLLLTLYGGKLTCYRSLSETIGDRITHHFGEYRRTRTADPNFWFRPGDSVGSCDVPEPDQRFLMADDGGDCLRGKKPR